MEQIYVNLEYKELIQMESVSESSRDSLKNDFL